MPDHSLHHSEARTCRNCFLLKHVAWSFHWVIICFYIVRNRDYFFFVPLLVVILYFLVMSPFSHLSSHPTSSAPSLVTYCEDDFSRCASLAQKSKWKHLTVNGCIYIQTISRERANYRGGNCVQCSQVLWASFFFCKIFTVFTSFFKTPLQNLQNFSHRNTHPWMAAAGGCWLLSEKQWGAPSSFLLLSLLIPLTGVFWIQLIAISLHK